MTSDVGL